MSRALSRRSFLQAGTAVAAAATGALGALPASAATGTGPGLPRPTPASAPKIRWWLPMADTDPGELVREVDAIADAGIGGVELIAMSVPGVDAPTYGWGSPAWEDRVTTVLGAARARNLTVDLTIGPQWPASSPALDTDSPAAAQELVYGHARVAGGATYDGPVPAPDPFDVGGGFGDTRVPGTPTLVALTAARLVDPAATAKPVLLDPGSVVDLTGLLHDGAVTWTAPPEGEWLLFSFWRRGTGQVVSGARSVAHVVDHYAAAGTDAVVAYWDANVLTPAVRRLLRQTGGDLFEDSLELQFVLPWTADLLTEFASRRGYALPKYLPVLLIQHLHAFTGNGPTPDSPADFDFPGDTGARVRNDFYQVLSELYETHHLDRIRAWAHSLGLKYRAQPGYGAVLDMASAARHVDVPETEQFFFGDCVDAYRAMAGTVHLTGSPVFSLETAPVLTAILQDAYGATWQRMLDIISRAFAGGVNQAVFHGFAYATAPGAQWPGWAPFAFPAGAPGPGFAEAWGPRQPSWRHMPDITGYLARQQRVLRAGMPRVDLAVYRQSYWDTSHDRLFTDSAVARAGYSYEAVPPALLAQDLPVGSGLLAPDGPGYQALVIPAGTRLDVATAEALVELADRRLPLVIVGAPPDRTPYLDATSTDDARVRELMARLLRGPRVVRVIGDADVPAALAALHVTPRVRPAEPVDLWSVTRQDQQAVYCWLFNPGPARVTTEVSLAATGTPYLLNAWTGEAAPLPRHRTDGGSTVLPVDLPPSGTVLLAVAQPGAFGAAPSGPPITASTTEVAWSAAGTTLRATSPGSYGATYQDGTTGSARITDVPAALIPTGWHLSVDDWRPGADAATTSVVTHELDLAELLPWPGIAGLEDVSGIGRYTASFDLPTKEWTGGRGAYLDLGTVFDTVRVTVNGHPLPPVDLRHPVMDLKGYLRGGRNTLQVEVSTTLRNRLRTLVPSQAATPRQDYGLLGPVTVRPYGEALL